MKVIKYIFALVISLSFSLNSYATTTLITLPWGEASGGFGTSIMYNSDYDSNLKIFDAVVAHSKAGEQRLYFSSAYLGDNNVCSYETSYPTSTTLVFNGQAVKMSSWCRKFGDANKYFYSYTPETERGHRYVVNLFRTSVSPVSVKLDNDLLSLPAIGFTRIWNSAGGNAI
ncbi:hypothetical protein [Psychrobacter piechaudii]|uniref:Uncharacterized protein n=1 Tax=Psychrobacter piechaudii TaxID=1945521 RepID=A0A1R4GUB7_9GAMM|nr:hypothetical protein [Psychrobacter piechaudii]SJM71789.1 hypothetical protein A1232T_01340 [Psychrobacter piechaudii]